MRKGAERRWLPDYRCLTIVPEYRTALCVCVLAGIREIYRTCLSESGRLGGMRLRLTWRTAVRKKVRLRCRASLATFVIYVARAGPVTAAARPMEASRLKEEGAVQHLWWSDDLQTRIYILTA